MSNQKWEFFCDDSYYHLWAVRPIGDGNFNSQRLFHVQSKEEAETLCNILNDKLPKQAQERLEKLA